MKSTNDYIRNVVFTVRFSFKELWTGNIWWAIMMLPIVTIPPAFAGLYYATAQLASENAVTRDTFFVGFRKYLLASYLWFLSNVLVLGLLLFNIDLSIQFAEVAWLQNLSIVYWILIAVWLSLQVYVFPLLIAQNEPRLLLAVRNSIILWLRHLPFSIFLSIVLVILIAFSTYFFPFWMVISAGLFTYICNLGMMFLLSKEKLPANGGE
jgi:uncharacterized membrane protein YesL